MIGDQMHRDAVIYLDGLFLNAQVRREGDCSWWATATCPCCGTSNSHEIAQRSLNGVKLRFWWQTLPKKHGDIEPAIYCLVEVGCNVCKVIWKIPRYFPHHVWVVQ